jgi:hypothetical protein
MLSELERQYVSVNDWNRADCGRRCPYVPFGKNDRLFGLSY